MQVKGCDAGPLPCGNVGVGHEVNPVTQLPYTPQIARRSDYVRVLGSDECFFFFFFVFFVFFVVAVFFFFSSFFSVWWDVCE